MCKPKIPKVEVREALPAAPVTPTSAMSVDQAGPKAAETALNTRRHSLRIDRTKRPARAGAANPGLNIPKN